MTTCELIAIKGGTGFSGTVISAIVRAFTLALELGRSLGTAIRRSKTKKYC
jgi:hypothetical protein